MNSHGLFFAATLAAVILGALYVELRSTGAAGERVAATAPAPRTPSPPERPVMAPAHLSAPARPTTRAPVGEIDSSAPRTTQVDRATAILEERRAIEAVLVTSGPPREAWTRDARDAFEVWLASSSIRDRVKPVRSGECYAAGCIWRLDVLQDIEATVDVLDGFNAWPRWTRLGVEHDAQGTHVSMVLFNRTGPLPI